MHNLVTNISVAVKSQTELILSSVESSLSSIFSKSDLLEIINQLQKNIHNSIDYQMEKHEQQNVIAQVSDQPTFNLDDVESSFVKAFGSFGFGKHMKVDYDTAEFELDGHNRIELTHVDLDIDEENFATDIWEKMEHLLLQDPNMPM